MKYLNEPEVLAGAKKLLFSEDKGYAITDVSQKGGNWSDTPKEVIEALKPFNTVTIGGKIPDLVGSDPQEKMYIQKDESSDAPLLVVEAKGVTGTSNEDGGKKTAVALYQTYRSLSEVNLGYVAVPDEWITDDIKSIAQNLNIGLIGVDETGANSHVIPRVRGLQTNNAVKDIQYLGSLGRSSITGFPSNRPKNYIGYALALHHSEDTVKLCERYVIGSSVENARKGAVTLGLVEDKGKPVLTPKGQELVRKIIYEYGSIDTALEKIQGLKGSRTLLKDAYPRFALLVRSVIEDYPGTKLVIDTLEDLHQEGIEEPSLEDLAVRLSENNPSLAVELFISPGSGSRMDAIRTDGTVREEIFASGENYRKQTHFQFKRILQSVGILEDTGVSDKVDPTEDVWKLSTTI